MSLEPKPAHYPTSTHLAASSPRSRQNDRNRVDPLMHKTPAAGSRVFDFHRVCAESEKALEPLLDSCRPLCCLNKSRILVGEEIRTHVCGAVCAVRSTRKPICDGCLSSVTLQYP